jgi:peptidoglycan/LPS O-acetylase OafA/YrhL
MRIWLRSLMWAILIVAVSMAGAVWLQESQRFPYPLFVGPVLPAMVIVAVAAGGPHEASGKPLLGPAIFVVATLMWFGLIELVRLIRARRR